MTNPSDFLVERNIVTPNPRWKESVTITLNRDEWLLVVSTMQTLVSLEARPDPLMFSALNLAQSIHAETQR